jgi:hypothetical protein
LSSGQKSLETGKPPALVEVLAGEESMGFSVPGEETARAVAARGQEGPE